MNSPAEKGRSSAASIELVRGPTGARTFRDRGVLFASRYDPVREGQAIAETLLAEEHDLLVILGLGLGHQLDAYCQASKRPVLVFEPSPERLQAARDARGSLPALKSKNVAYTTDPQQFSEYFSSVYTAGIRVQTHIHPALCELEPEITHDALKRLTRAKSGALLRDVTRAGMSPIWAGLTANNAAQLLERPNFSRLEGVADGLPAVVVAAGPSLDKQLETLKQIQDRVLIVAIGQSLKALRTAGIRAHLVHVVESQDVTHQFRLAGPGPPIQLVLTPSAHADLFRLPTAETFVNYPTTNRFAQWIAAGLGETRWTGGGATVAQGAVAVAAAAGANPILLIGQDLAYTDGKTYGSTTVYGDLELVEKNDGSFAYTNMDDKWELFGREKTQPNRETAIDLLSVPGWHGDSVLTTPSYASFIDLYAGIARDQASRGVRIVNCTEGGAYIPELEHETFVNALSNIQESDIDLHEEIRIRSSNLPRRDIQELRRRLRNASNTVTSIRSRAKRAFSKLEEVDRARQSDPQLAKILRVVARAEKEIRRLLAGLGWFDDLVAAELQRAQVEHFRRLESDPADLDLAIEESRHVLMSCLRGCDSADALLQVVNRALEDFGETRV